MRTITDILALAEGGTLAGSDVLQNLYDSEGKKGSAHVKSTGHPLQHIAVLRSTPTGQLQMLGTRYHKRGPAKIHGVTGNVVNQGGPQSHSQFKDDAEAADMIATALSSAGGIRALKIIKDPHCTVKAEVGLAPGMTALQRTASVNSTDVRCQFVLIDETTMSGVVLELHPSSLTTDGLHFQSAYPVKSGGPASGKATLSIVKHGTTSSASTVEQL